MFLPSPHPRIIDPSLELFLHLKPSHTQWISSERRGKGNKGLKKQTDKNDATLAVLERDPMVQEKL